jgi:hypothetical protein
MPPHQEHTILVIDQHHHRCTRQAHDVTPEPIPVRHLHVDLAKPDPLVVIDRPLAERPPPALLTAAPGKSRKT